LDFWKSLPKIRAPIFQVLKNEVIPRLPPGFDAFGGVSQRHPFRRMVRRDLEETFSV
jgi:hypothetical protein